VEALAETATQKEPALLPEAPTPAGYLNAVQASYGHALQAMVRRQRLILAAVISFLPVLVVLATALFSSAQFAQEGNVIFAVLVERLHIDGLGPLLALFFATMLIGEEAEGQTIPYILTRPIPRSAWVLGRFLAYAVVASLIIIISLALTFAASTILPGISFNRAGLTLLLHYTMVGIAALLCYGAFTMFLGAYSRRPIILGVVLLYGWQRIATLVPGVVDFLTIQKYTSAMLPVLPTQREDQALQEMIAGFAREEYMITAARAGLVLVVLVLVFLALTVLTVRMREYTSARAIGS